MEGGCHIVPGIGRSCSPLDLTACQVATQRSRCLLHQARHRQWWTQWTHPCQAPAHVPGWVLHATLPAACWKQRHQAGHPLESPTPAGQHARSRTASASAMIGACYCHSACTHTLTRFPPGMSTSRTLLFPASTTSTLLLAHGAAHTDRVWLNCTSCPTAEPEPAEPMRPWNIPEVVRSYSSLPVR